MNILQFILQRQSDLVFSVLVTLAFASALINVKISFLLHFVLLGECSVAVLCLGN